MYSKETGKPPLLSAAEEAELAKRMEQGDETAKQRLAESNLCLAVSIAKKYAGSEARLSELIREGSLNLISLVENFDYSKGDLFSYRATWLVRHAVIRAVVSREKPVKIPVHMAEAINKFTRTSRQLLSEYGREPTDEELAENMQISEDKVREIRKIVRESASAKHPTGEE
ncbi:MAG: hypothetical protein LUD81_09385 [Clostridiales bacterium]|nr:hypothetical protein [Clostridiales bacterium]